MTARDMFYENTPTYITQLNMDERMGIRDDLFLVVTSTAANVVNVIYKNQGWYAAGSVLEEWVTSGAPSTTPPSGHTLTQLQHLVIG